MSARLREWLGPALLVLGLVAVTLVTVSVQTPEGQDSSNGSSFSPNAGGTLALYLWLGAGGYPVARLENAATFADGLAATDVLWVLTPQQAYSQAQAQTVLDWVATGGTLVLAAEGQGIALAPSADALQTGLGLQFSPLLPAINATLALQQPVFAQPPVPAMHIATSWTLDVPRPEVVPLVSAGPDPVLATWRYGYGRVFVVTSAFPFSNAGLDRDLNGPLAWNLAGSSGRGRRQAFDEVHHGYSGTDLRTLLLSQPWGWALIYALAAVILFLLLRGQRLGPPLAAATTGDRRGTMDYVLSLAGLFHRANRTEWAAARYAATFRRALAAPYGFDAAAPPAVLAAEVAASHPQIAADDLRRVLERLDAAASATPRLSDAALLRLVQEAEALKAQIET
jgi:hypothetical protein